MAALGVQGLQPELKRRIEIMAEHVAKNGLEFENSVKQKNAGNPQFGFLFNADGADYYAQLLQAHRASQTIAEPSSQDPQLVELMNKWKEPPVQLLPVESLRNLNNIVASLEQQASKDAVQAGRLWVEASVEHAAAIAGNLMRRVQQLSTASHRLHILFLLHDILQSEFVRQEPVRTFATTFRPYLVWLFRPSFQLAQSTSPNGEDAAKVLKLLQLWGERGIIPAQEAEEMKILVVAQQLPQDAIKTPAPPPLVPSLASLIPGLQLPPPPQPPQPLQHLQQSINVGAGKAPAQPQVPRPPPPTAPPAPPGQLPGSSFTGGSPTAASSSAAFPLMPVAALPGRGSHTPETVPVGVMSSMLKQVSKRGKDLHTAFVPYKPLDPFFTPQTLPPVSLPSPHLLERLREYYEMVGELIKDDKVVNTASVASSPAALANQPSQQRSRSRSPQASAMPDQLPPPHVLAAASGRLSAVPPVD